jgi:hypothetical protein
MTGLPVKKDLIILVADNKMLRTVQTLLQRPEALGIRSLTYDPFAHVERDPGCLQKGPDFLLDHLKSYSYGMILLDRKGCGQEDQSREVLERNLETRLAQSGWEKRAKAIVIDPELEAWVWSDSPHVDVVMGWQGKRPTLKDWLQGKGFLQKNQVKPHDPKTAFRQALRQVRKPFSSSLYAQLAEKVGLQRCADPAFQKFKNTLSKWFPPPGEKRGTK